MSYFVPTWLEASGGGARGVGVERENFMREGGGGQTDRPTDREKQRQTENFTIRKNK